MKRLALVFVLLAACGGKQTTTTTDPEPKLAPPLDPRTPLEKRRDAACETLGPELTQCALAEAKADLAAGKVKQEQFDQDTKTEVLHKNTDEFIKQCEQPMSSRQVRVLEVCQQQETQCDPLAACLDHLNDKPAAK